MTPSETKPTATDSRTESRRCACTEWDYVIGNRRLPEMGAEKGGIA